MSLLSVSDLRIHFHSRRGVVRAVDGVSFELERGRTLGIVGESGSGKSAACLGLLGLLPAPPACIESGSVVFDGRELIGAGEAALRAVRGHRISMIFQDPLSSLNPYLSIGTQLLEPLTVHLRLSRRAARERAIAALGEVGIEDAAARFDQYPHEFSGGMRQRVMIAMALSTEPDILVADEPTTALDATIQAQILDLIRRVQARRSLAMLFVSHNLGVVAGIADDVMVMQSGACVERGSAEEVFSRPKHPYTRRLLASVPTAGKPTPPPAHAADAPPHLEIEALGVDYARAAGWFSRRSAGAFRAVDDVSLRIRRGEILGLVGESGSGKSTLARAVVRLVEPSAGSIRLDGVDLAGLDADALRALRPRVQMVFQDPYSSLDPRMSVAACLREALRQRALPRHRVAEESLQLLADVGLGADHLPRYPHELSGGQRQRVAVARALALHPEVIVADEPVSSLDVTVQAQILDLFLDINARRGVTLIVISHDLSVIRRIADRVAVMYRGRIVECGDTEAVYREPTHAYTRALLAAIPVLRPVRSAGRLAAPDAGRTG